MPEQSSQTASSLSKSDKWHALTDCLKPYLDKENSETIKQMQQCNTELKMILNNHFTQLNHLERQAQRWRLQNQELTRTLISRDSHINVLEQKLKFKDEQINSMQKCRAASHQECEQLQKERAQIAIWLNKTAKNITKVLPETRKRQRDDTEYLELCCEPPAKIIINRDGEPAIARSTSSL